MYKSFSPGVLKEMKNRGEIIITIRPGWENAAQWSYIPGFISYCIGQNREHIFSCYISKDTETVQLTNIVPTKLINENKSLIDAYMYVAIKGLMELTEGMGAKRLVIDSLLPAAADHMLDAGFSVTPKGPVGTRGCKTLKDKP